MRTIVPLAALVLSSAGPAMAAPARDWSGVWRNPANSVHVRVTRCGKRRASGLCGTVTWASRDAKRAVAARGRTLVGTRLFGRFREGRDGRWHGRLLVPDLARDFTGTVTVKDRGTIVGQGCLLGGLACRSQVWTRVRG